MRTVGGCRVFAWGIFESFPRENVSVRSLPFRGPDNLMSDGLSSVNQSSSQTCWLGESGLRIGFDSWFHGGPTTARLQK